MSRLFVTGGTGFVGSRLLPALLERGHTVSALDRTGVLRRLLTGRPGLDVVVGDLLEPGTYAGAIGASDMVVHLAAATGRAPRAEHQRINAAGTAALAGACRLGSPRLLFVSSIAAGFPDHRAYPYAEAKLAAEHAVRQSGCPFTIVRPTMILGADAPVLEGLEALARLPVIPVFGTGQTPVQPIHVDDVVRALVLLIEEGPVDGQTLELGGPERLSIEDLLQRIRAARSGGRGRAIHVPLALVVPPLRLAEWAGLTALLPVTAGQLSSFRFPGTAHSNPLMDTLLPAARPVGAMVAPRDPSATERVARDRECRVFAAHLLGVQPDAYVRQKYAEAHSRRPGLAPADRFERTLVAAAASHRVLAALADAYARIFLPDSVLRRKLVLLLALLESASPSAAAVDRPVSGTPGRVAIRLLARGAVAVALLVAGAVVFTPIRLAVGGRPR